MLVIPALLTGAVSVLGQVATGVAHVRPLGIIAAPGLVIASVSGKCLLPFSGSEGYRPDHAQDWRDVA